MRIATVEASHHRMGLRAPGAQRAEGNGAFTIVLIALLVEFGRPQDIVPGLKVIPFASLLDGLLMVAVFSAGKFNFTIIQTRFWVALLALMFVHIPFATNNFWALMLSKDMFLTFGMYLGIVTFVDSLEKFKRLMKVWLGVHTLLAVLGVLSGGHGVGGWLGDENDFCMQIDVATAFALFLMSSRGAGLSRPMYIGILSLFILAVIATFSRGGFLGLIAVGLYWWIRSSNKIMPAFLAGMAALLMVIVAPDKYWEEISSTTSDETLEIGTGGERLYTWGIGWEMFLHNPIMGVGPGNFPWVFEEYQGERTFNDRSLAGRAAHSLYFTLLPELGSIGFGLFLGMLIYSVKDLQWVNRAAKSVAKEGDYLPEIRRKNMISNAILQARAIEGAFIAYLVSSIFVTTIYYPTFWVLVAFAVALRNCVSNELDSEQKTEERPHAQGAFRRGRKPAISLRARGN